MFKNKNPKTLNSEIAINDKNQGGRKEMDLYLAYIGSYIYAINLLASLNGCSEYCVDLAKKNIQTRLDVIAGGKALLQVVTNQNIVGHIAQIMASCSDVVLDLQDQYRTKTGDEDIDIKVREDYRLHEDPIKVIDKMSALSADIYIATAQNIRRKKRQIALYLLAFFIISISFETIAYLVAGHIDKYAYARFILVLFVSKLFAAFLMILKLRKPIGPK